MYAAFIGFLLTFIIGITLSFILKQLNKQGKERIYTDDTKTTINPDLFMPPIAKCIRRRNVVFEEKLKKDEIDKY